MRQLLTIQTPENVTFDFELAGLSVRAVAWLVDIGLMLGAIMLSGLVLAPLGTAVGGFALALFFVVVFAVFFAYPSCTEWLLRGQTIGKRVVGLRTVQQDGTPITFLQALVRNIVHIVDMLPSAYAVGGLSALLDPYNRRLGDLAAGTVVVRDKRAPRPAAIVPPAERTNAFLSDPDVMHAVRRVNPPERDAMVALALRREGLPLPVRYELFARMSSHLEERLGVRRPPHFSEEKFVLNLTAAVLNQAPLQPSSRAGGGAR